MPVKRGLEGRQIIMRVHGLLSSGDIGTFMWLLSHVGLADNVAVDAAVRAALTLSPISHTLLGFRPGNQLELYYSFYFAIRIFGANIRIVFEYSVPSPSESKQHWLRCRCSRSFTSRTNITSGG
jgi:hypothetical protein